MKEYFYLPNGSIKQTEQIDNVEVDSTERKPARWVRAVVWFTLSCFIGQPVLSLAQSIGPTLSISRNVGTTFTPSSGGTLAPISCGVGSPICGAGTDPRITVETTSQGRPLVNINEANPDGVSYNRYYQFNVNEIGAVLNNNNGGPTRANVAIDAGSTATGVFVQDAAKYNPNLGTSTAKLILNEVTSTNQSQLKGPLSVAGPAADVIVANPNGITCNGCGFINTTRGMLTTGTPTFNTQGQLNSIAVAQGQIAIGDKGLIDYQTPQIDLIAGNISINGQIQNQVGGQTGQANGVAGAVGNLNIIAGQNTVTVRNSASSAYINDGANDLTVHATAPMDADTGIDVGRLGGMYAGQIRLVSTNHGVGVNSAGTIYSIGDVKIESDGSMHLGVPGTNADGSTGYGVVESGYYTNLAQTAANDPRGAGGIRITGAAFSGSGLLLEGGAIDNTFGTLRAHAGDITIKAASLDNTKGSIIANGSGDITISTSGLLINKGDGSNIQANAGYGTLSALGIDNSLGGQLYAKRDLDIETGAGGFNNSGSSTHDGGLVNADEWVSLISGDGALDNSNKGTIQAKNAGLFVSMTHIDNSNEGNLRSGVSVDLTASSNDIDNRHGGVISSGGSVELAAELGNVLNSSSGQILAKGDRLNITAMTVDNSQAGTIRAIKNLNITATDGDIDNSQGGVIDGSKKVNLTASGDLLNAAGSVQSRRGMTIDAANVDNAAGLIQDIDIGNISITTGNLSNLAGTYTDQDGHTSIGGKISSYSGGLSIVSTNLTNSGLINSGGTESDAVMSISGLFNNTGRIQGARNLWMDFEGSPGQTNAGTISSAGYMIIENASSFLNTGSADSSGNCGGLCTEKSLFFTGGTLVNKGMIRALDDVYLGIGTDGDVQNAKGLTRLDNQYGAAIIAVNGDVKAKVTGSDLTSGSNGQSIDPQVLADAQAVVAAALATKTSAQNALTNVNALRGGVNSIGITEDALNNLQSSSLVTILETAKINGQQLQTDADAVTQAATDTSLGNSNLTTNATSVATLAKASGISTVSLATDAGSALTAARDFFGWSGGLLENTLANMPTTSTLTDYVTALTNLKNSAQLDLQYPPGFYFPGSSNDPKLKLQNVIDKLVALNQVNQITGSYAVTTNNLVPTIDAEIGIKQATLDQADLAKSNADSALIAITGPIADSQALQTAQSAMQAKQNVVDQINTQNAGLVVAAANAQAALTIANANKIDADKALTNAQALQSGLSSIVSVGNSLANVAGASLTDKVLATQNIGAQLRQIADGASFAASDTTVQTAELKNTAATSAPAVTKSASTDARNSVAAADALAAALDKSFDLAPTNQTTVNNLNNTNQAAVGVANSAVAQINAYKNNLGPSDTMRKVLAALAEVNTAATNLSTAASTPPAPQSGAAPADPPTTATQKANATQSAIDALYEAAGALDVAINSGGLAFVLEIGGGNIGNGVGKLIEFSSVVNSARNSATQSASAKAALVQAIDAAFAATPANKALIDKMNAANAAAANDASAASQLIGFANNEVGLKQTGVTSAAAAQTAANSAAQAANSAVDGIQTQLINANNDLVNSVVDLSKVANAAALVSSQVALKNQGTIYAGRDITLALEPTQGKLATLYNESHQDSFNNEDGGLIQAGRSMSLGRDCGLDDDGHCTKDVWTNAAGGVTVNNTARIKTIGTDADGTPWGTGGDINIQAEVFHNSISDPGVTNDVGPHTRYYLGDSGYYASGIDPYVHVGTHGGYVMGVTPSWNTSPDPQSAITNTAIYASAVTGSSVALGVAVAACPVTIVVCFAIPGLAAALVAAQLSYTGAFYRDFTELWTTTQHFNTPLSKARPNIIASNDLVIREKNGTNIGGTLAAGHNVTIKPIDGQINGGTFINKALVLQKFDYTLNGRTESRCGPGDTLCTGGPTRVLGDITRPLGAPVTTTRIINGISQSYGGVIQALNGTAGITVGTLINLGATDDSGNVPDLGRPGLNVSTLSQGIGSSASAGFGSIDDAPLGVATKVSTLAGGNFAEITLPTGNNGLFIKAQPSSPYLVISNPLYGGLSTAPGIDTLFRDYYGAKATADAFQQKLIGDARYQAQLVSDQILAQTGLASLGSSLYGPDMMEELAHNAFEENLAAMARADALVAANSGADGSTASAGSTGFAIGQALTEEQQAGLTKDIVWLVSELVNGQAVLVPKVYLSPETKAKIAGGQILGKNVDIKTAQLYNVGGNIQATGTADDGTGGKVNIAATGGVTNVSGNIKGETVKVDAKTLYLGTTISRAGDADNYADTAGKVGTIEGGKGGVSVTTTNDTNIFGGQIKSVGGDVAVKSTEGNVNIKSLVLEKKTTETSASGGLFEHSTHSDVATTQSALTAGISATKSADGSGGNVALSGKTGINLTGAAIKGEGNVSLDSTDGSVNDRALYLTSTRQTKDSQTGGKSENTPTTFNYSYGTDTTTTDERDKQGVGSSIQAGNKLSISAKNIISEGGVYSGKTGDLQTKGEGVVAFNAIKNEYSKTTTKTSDRAVFSGSVDGAVNKAVSDKEKKKQKTASLNDKKTAAPDEVASMKAGYGRETSTQEVNATTYDNALLAFSNGINIKADNKDGSTSTGKSVLDLGSLDAYSSGDITMQAGRVISTKNENTYSEKNSSSSTFVGANADLHSSLMTAIKEGQAGNDTSSEAVATLTKGMGGVAAGVGFEHNTKESTYTATAENIAHVSGGNVSIKSSQGNMTLAGVDLSATGQTYQQDTTNKFVAGKNGYKLDPATGNILNPQGKVVKDKDGYLIGTDGNRLLQGGNLSLQASEGDVDIIAARNTSSFTSNQTSVGANVGVAADFNPAAMVLSTVLPGIGDLILGAASGGHTASFHAGGDKGKGSDVSHTDSQLSAAGKLTVQSSKRDVNLTGVTAVGADVAISAGHSLNNNAYQDSSSYEQSSTYVGASTTLAGGPPTGILSKNANGNSTHEAGNTIYALGSQTVDTKGNKQHVDGNLTMTATTGDVKLHGGDYYGDNATITASQGNINIIAAKDTATKHSEQGGAQITMGASASFADFGGGVSYGSLDGGKAEYKLPDALKEKEKEPEKEADAVGIKGKREPLGATTQNQINKQAALKAGGFGDNVYEGSGVTFSDNAFTNTGMDTLRDTSAITQKGAGSSLDGLPSNRSKISGELVSANAGIGIDYKSSDTKDITYQNAQINVAKKLNVQAKQGTVDIGGVDIGNVDPSGKVNKDSEVNIVAEEIKTTKYVDVHESKTVDNSAFVGVKAEGHSVIADAAAHATKHIVNAVKGKDYSGKDGGGLNASDYAKGRFAAQTVAEVAVDAANIATGDLIGGSANLAVTDTHSETVSKETSENINQIKGGKINLQSTKRDITLTGVKIEADADTGSVTLDSARALNITAAKSTSESKSSTHNVGLSGGANVGVNVQALATTGEIGPGVSAAASYSYNESKTNETSWENSSVKGANVTVKSKKDTNLTGANIEGKDVALDVGGNLNVTSLQDTKDNSGWSMQADANVGASLSAYTLVGPSGGGGGGGGANWDKSAKVAKQAGITASNSLSGNVAGDVNLKGAALEDTSGDSKLGVGGMVRATAIQDSEDKDGFTGYASAAIGKASKGGAKSEGGTIGYTSDESIKYDATQNATIAGINLVKTRTDKDTSGKTSVIEMADSHVQVQGNLNTDSSKKTVVTRNDYTQAFDSMLNIPGLPDSDDDGNKKKKGGDDDESSGRPPRLDVDTPPPNKVEDTPPPKKKVEDDTPPPKNVEDTPPPKKVEDTPPPKKVEDTPPPKKVEDTPPPKKVEDTPPPKKVEDTPPPKKVEDVPPPKKVEEPPKKTPPPVTEPPPATGKKKAGEGGDARYIVDQNMRNATTELNKVTNSKDVPMFDPKKPDAYFAKVDQAIQKNGGIKVRSPDGGEPMVIKDLAALKALAGKPISGTHEGMNVEGAVQKAGADGSRQVLGAPGVKARGDQPLAYDIRINDAGQFTVSYRTVDAPPNKDSIDNPYNKNSPLYKPAPAGQKTPEQVAYDAAKKAQAEAAVAGAKARAAGSKANKK